MEKRFRTSFEIPALNRRIAYGDRILFTGSCFTENISDKMLYHKFNAIVNPFGIIYNPFSIVTQLLSIIKNTAFTVDDIFEENGIFKSFHFHSRIADTDKENMLQKMNAAVQAAHVFLSSASHLIITLGTANVYALRSSGMIVANNHKQPSQFFDPVQFTPDAIINIFDELLSGLKVFNPKLNIILTVSPVRHMRDGAMVNAHSKAILIHAVHSIMKQHPQVYYFPAYEIMMDDLRDYRFYAEDMLHPSVTAIDYIFDKFKYACIEEECYSLMASISEIRTAAMHRPFFPETDAHRKFKMDMLQKIKLLQQRYDSIDLTDEIAFFNT